MATNDDYTATRADDGYRDEAWRKLVDEGQANTDRCLEHRRQLYARIRNLRALLARERLFRRQWQEEARRNYYRLLPNA